MRSNPAILPAFMGSPGTRIFSLSPATSFYLSIFVLQCSICQCFICPRVALLCPRVALLCLLIFGTAATSGHLLLVVKVFPGPLTSTSRIRRPAKLDSVLFQQCAYRRYGLRSRHAVHQGVVGDGQNGFIHQGPP
jgi:hypothetical protein